MRFLYVTANLTLDSLPGSALVMMHAEIGRNRKPSRKRLQPREADGLVYPRGYPCVRRRSCGARDAKDLDLHSYAPRMKRACMQSRMERQDCMISASHSWRADAFHPTTSDTVSTVIGDDSHKWRKPSLRDVGTVLAFLAAPIVLGTVGLVLAHISRLL